ncbi:hypothetical protein Calkro_0065 [Caldicellulosiruptor kronotskyensis 2002]|uniref:Uncharacterized protein n=1 Tax=Caldicellulosiruptor kronotskyensis (strain DSM 18902 / VKM B-2412 / 2002) TaxID=632348 RepID=E4SCC6_CALK2|nr:two-component system activity regulator YycH [Caldicellulosiruptor kronotskyensis]ADQ44981.1 hypothetical protein Calkro_0065 [Caldicellulosiruptor kronotskyensis 2002]
MKYSKKEFLKSIVLSILVILSIYLYYKIYFDYKTEDIIKLALAYKKEQSQQQLLKKAKEILVSPKEMYLNISKNITLRILSNQNEYLKVVSKFIEGIERGFVKREVEVSTKNLNIDFFKSGRYLIFCYDYPVNLNVFLYELTRRTTDKIPKGFEFDKIFIKEDSNATIVYFFNSQKQVAILQKFDQFGFLPLERVIEKNLSIIYSWADGLGFTEIAKNDVLIPIEFSDVQFSEIKIKDSSFKKEWIVRRLFPDTILTRKNILKDGDIAITDERKMLVFKNDRGFEFEYTEKAFGDRVDSVCDTLMFYLKTFYTDEDLRVFSLKTEKEGNFTIKLGLRTSGIDIASSDEEYCVEIEVKSGRIYRISGYIFDIIKVRTSQIKVEGIAAIDTLKERKGDIFIEDIDIEYVLGGASSYPYWKIKTQNGVAFVETIK